MIIAREQDVTATVLAVMERTSDSPNDSHIDSDVQFGVTRALIGNFVRHETPHSTAPDVTGPYYSLDHTYRLEAGEAVLPRPPIKWRVPVPDAGRKWPAKSAFPD